MALEIERRFLITNDHWKDFITNKTSIEQGIQKFVDWYKKVNE